MCRPCMLCWGFHVQDANVNGMELRAGNGNEYVSADGKPLPTEDDLLNVSKIKHEHERLGLIRAQKAWRIVTSVQGFCCCLVWLDSFLNPHVCHFVQDHDGIEYHANYRQPAVQ